MTDLDFTPEAEPSAAALIFGDRIETARKYTAALVRDGETWTTWTPRIPKDLDQARTELCRGC